MRARTPPDQRHYRPAQPSFTDPDVSAAPGRACPKTRRVFKMTQGQAAARRGDAASPIASCFAPVAQRAVPLDGRPFADVGCAPSRSACTPRGSTTPLFDHFPGAGSGRRASTYRSPRITPRPSNAAPSPAATTEADSGGHATTHIPASCSGALAAHRPPTPPGGHAQLRVLEDVRGNGQLRPVPLRGQSSGPIVGERHKYEASDAVAANGRRLRAAPRRVKNAGTHSFSARDNPEPVCRSKAAPRPL